jgi:hypothetical protein
VYLYRLLAKDATGADLGRFERGTGRFFRQAWGKVVVGR